MIKVTEKIQFNSHDEFKAFIQNNFLNFDDLINFVKNSKTISKWDILFAFQKFQDASYYYHSKFVKNNHFSKFINSELFTDEEIYNHFVSNEEDLSKMFNFPKITIILDKINMHKYWKEITKPEELKNYIERYAKKDSDIIEFAKHFSYSSPELYTTVINFRPAGFYLRHLSNEELLNSPDALHEYINKDLNNIFHNMPYSRSDLTNGIGLHAIEKKDAILKSIMINPNNAMLSLRKMLTTKLITLKEFKKNNYSIEQVNSLPNDIKSVLRNYENVWKIHTVPEFILHTIPKGEEWRVLEYFAAKNPETMQKLINLGSNVSPFSRITVLEHYKDADTKNLPKALNEYIEESKEYFKMQQKIAEETALKQKQKREQKESLWLNSKNELIQYFAITDNGNTLIKIRSKDDYLNIADFFKNSNLSIEEFCKNYQIDSADGFKKMLSRVADENSDFKKFYDEHLSKEQEQLKMSCKNKILSIIENPLSISKVINNSDSSENFSKLIEASENLFDNKDITLLLTENIIHYYYSRLNSYNESSSEISNINKMLTKKEMSFIFQPELIDKINEGKFFNIIRELTKPIENVKSKLSEESKYLLYHSPTSIKSKIYPYTKTFNPTTYMLSKNQFQLDDGSFVIVSDDIIDRALCYAHTHDLFKTSMLMNKIIKEVAIGHIQNQNETQQYKLMLSEDILKRMQNCKELSMAINKKQLQPE